MRTFLRILGVMVVAVLLIGAVLTYRVLNAAGYANAVTSKFAGQCQAVPGVVGVEDIELDRQTGLMFLSAQDRRPITASNWKQGGIYLAQLAHPEIPPISLTAIYSRPIHPHGISLFTDEQGRKTLAVVNHPEKSSSEVFLFDVNETVASTKPFEVLTMRRTIRDPLLANLNDITLVSHDAFYATNDHGSTTALGETLEDFLLLPRANVVYFDGTKTKIAATGFNYANGINHSADGKYIYVAETTGRKLSAFYRDTQTGTLAISESVSVAYGLDNIDVASDGQLWIAGHPHMLDFLSHARDEKQHSPSAVLTLQLAGTATLPEVKPETVYLNTGDEISGSSVAVAHNGRLVIGSVSEKFFLNCTLNE